MHHIRIPNDNVPRTLPAIGNWDYDEVKNRELYELKNGGFGNFKGGEHVVDQEPECVVIKTVQVLYTLFYFDVKDKLLIIY